MICWVVYNPVIFHITFVQVLDCFVFIEGQVHESIINDTFDVMTK